MTRLDGDCLAEREVALVEKAALHVGMKSLMNFGAASCVYSEGCAGVSQTHLIAFAREVAVHCVAALSANKQPKALDDPRLQGKAEIFAQVAELMRGIDAYAYDYRASGKLAASRNAVSFALYDALSAPPAPEAKPQGDSNE